MVWFYDTFPHLQYLWDGCLVSAFCFFYITCLILEALFDELHKRMSSFHSVLVDIGTFKTEHHRLCELVQLADKMLAPVLFGLVSLYIPLICFNCYRAINLPEEEKVVSLVSNLFWLLASSSLLAVIMIFGSRVCEKVCNIVCFSTITGKLFCLQSIYLFLLVFAFQKPFFHHLNLGISSWIRCILSVWLCLSVDTRTYIVHLMFLFQIHNFHDILQTSLGSKEDEKNVFAALQVQIMQFLNIHEVVTLLLVLAFSEGFSWGSPVFLPPRKPKSPNSNSTRIEDPHENTLTLKIN